MKFRTPAFAEVTVNAKPANKLKDINFTSNSKGQRAWIVQKLTNGLDRIYPGKKVSQIN